MLENQSLNQPASQLRIFFTGLISTFVSLVVLGSVPPVAQAIDCSDEAAIREHLMRNAQSDSLRDREQLACDAAAISPLINIIKVEAERPLRLDALAALGRIGFEMQSGETADLSALQAVPAFLFEILEDSEDGTIRQGAVCALRSVSTSSDTVVPQLLDIFEIESDLNFRHTLLGTISSLIDRQRLSYCGVDEAGSSHISVGHQRDVSAQTINLVVKSLTHLLEEPIEEDAGFGVRRFYSNVLQTMGRLGEAALPAVPAMLKIDSFFVRADASEAIARIGAPALPILLDYFESPPSEDPNNRNAQRIRVLNIIGNMESLPNDQILPFYLEILQSPTSTQAQKNAVLDNLSNSRLEPTSAELLPLYLEMLRTEDAVSEALIRAIAAFGPDASDALPRFVQLLKTPIDLRVKVAIVQTFPKFGQAAATEGIPILAEILKTSDEANLRKAAARALGQIASDGINPQLVNLSAEEREIAETVLGAFTGGDFSLPDDSPIPANLDLPNLEIAIAALFQAFETDTEAAVAAARALGSIGVNNPTFASALLARAEAAGTNVSGSEVSVSASNGTVFTNVLQDLLRKSQDARLLGANEDEINDNLMRIIRLLEQDCEAVFTLTAAFRLVPSPATAVTEALIDAVNRNLCPEQGLVLAFSKIEIASNATPILSLLTGLAEQEDFNAIFTLGSLGSDAAETAPTLLQVAQTSTNRTSRTAAIHALGRIGTDNPDAIRFLQETLQDPDAASIHTISALSLGLIGAPAQSTLPTLVERLELLALEADNTDFDEYLPGSLANAIANIIQNILSTTPALSQEERAELVTYIERSLTAIDRLPTEFQDLKTPLQKVLERSLISDNEFSDFATTKDIRNAGRATGLIHRDEIKSRIEISYF